MADFKDVLKEQNKPIPVSISTGEVFVFPGNVGIIMEISNRLRYPESFEEVSDEDIKRAVVEVMCHDPEQVIDDERPSDPTIDYSRLLDDDVSEIVDEAANTLSDQELTEDSSSIEIVRSSIESITRTNEELVNRIIGNNPASRLLKNNFIDAAQRLSDTNAKILGIYNRPGIATGKAAQNATIANRATNSFNNYGKKFESIIDSPDEGSMSELTEALSDYESPTERNLREINKSVHNLIQLSHAQNDYHDTILELQRDATKISIEKQQEAIDENKQGAKRANGKSTVSLWIASISVLLLALGTGFNGWLDWSASKIQQQALKNQESIIQALEENNTVDSEWQNQMIELFNQINEKLSEEDTNRVDSL